MTNRQGKKWKQILKSVTDFLFSGSKITVDGDRSHTIKRCLFLRRKAMTNLDGILKSRDIFPVVMYRCGTWIIKKAEHWRMAAFNLWCWRRLLSVLWTVRRSSQLVLKEINPEYSYWIWICWSWSSNTLATGCEEPTYWKRPWCWKDWGRRRRGQQRMRCLDGYNDSMDEFEQTLGDSEGQGSLACCSPWIAKSQTWLIN